MRKMSWPRFGARLGALLLLLLCLPTSAAWAEDELVLLLPDDVSVSDARVGAWLDAAREEGLRIKVLQDTAFLNLGTGVAQYPGVILPDQVHQRASDVLVSALTSYAAQGGKLMLVFDAGALTSSGFYAVPKSRFSALVGVDYLLYDELRDYTVGFGPVTGLSGLLRGLQVPPGKSMLYSASSGGSQVRYLPSGVADVGGLRNFTPAIYSSLNIEGGSQAVLSGAQTLDSQVNSILGPRLSVSTYSLIGSLLTTITNLLLPPSDPLHAVSGYGYGYLSYPSYVTRGSFSGKALLGSPNFGLVAGYKPYGSGGVLFVNLPLGYLEGQTDGMLLHGFLRYFGGTLLAQPRLTDHPSGVGGLVLNWHVDSSEALVPMRQLQDQGVWNEGPFSIHLTAGPDTITPGDGIGLNVPGNPATQEWIRYFVQKKHQVGSHGGWIHDYFGLNANETNQAEFEPYLALNKQAIEQVSGLPVTEYSAPVGNNPKWAVSWLEANGIKAYYTGEHTGMGPTRAYREGQLLNPGLWAFPVTPFGRYATFEEFEEFHVSAADISGWYRELLDFVGDNHTSRLIYMHPPGAVDYPAVLNGLFDQARLQKFANRFRWYTMTGLAQFEERRAQVTWQTSAVPGLLGLREISASHPSSLAEMTWLLPRSRYGLPVVVQGLATVSSDDQNWVVVALSGKTLRFRAALLK